ncbi:predicted protein [Botrytis cinerea T4]|uniref:Uncharacterized protein n=1 Tax=Botryotinia fuckeliana (strain T4) TaxID=999810 RepID=G2Y9D6_BOTF4|nr:predicted protein [Botrytis cinerea T4]
MRRSILEEMSGESYPGRCSLLTAHCSLSTATATAQLPAARHCIDQQKPRSFDFYSSFNPHALLCYNSPVEKGKARSRKCNGSPTVMLLVNDAKSKGRED